VLAIPQSWIDDAGFPIWQQVRDRVAGAFAKRVDETLIFAVAPVPASFPAGGIVAAAGTAISGTDVLDALDQGLAKIEGQGLVPNGIASSAAINSALRKQLRDIAAPASESPTASVYGVEVGVAASWDSTVGDAIAGDWSKLVVGVRQDIRFETSTDAIIQDATGAIVANAFQEDLVALRCYMRMGAAIGRPVGPTGTPVEPFALVDWTAAAPPLAAGTRAKAKS
jgi:hypothetical protein